MPTASFKCRPTFFFFPAILRCFGPSRTLGRLRGVGIFNATGMNAFFDAGGRKSPSWRRLRRCPARFRVLGRGLVMGSRDSATLGAPRFIDTARRARGGGCLGVLRTTLLNCSPSRCLSQSTVVAIGFDQIPRHFLSVLSLVFESHPGRGILPRPVCFRAM